MEKLPAPILVRDEEGLQWWVLEGDPAWSAVSKAKNQLLLPEIVIARSIIQSGQSNPNLSDAVNELSEYLTACQHMPEKTLRSVWNRVSLRFRAWRVQQAVFGNKEGSEPPAPTQA